MAHHGKTLPDAYMVVAGCFIGSCGWIDAAMYTITRGVFVTRSSNASNSYSRGGTDRGARGFDDGSAIRARDRIFGFDDMTGFRTVDGDGDITPPEAMTTTVVVGGKNVDIYDGARSSVSSPPPIAPSKSHKILGITRKTSISKPNLGRVEEIEDERDLIESAHRRPEANSHRISTTALRSDQLRNCYSRSQPSGHSPSDSYDTPSGSVTTDANEPPVSPISVPFGQIKKQTTIHTTHEVL